MHVQFVELYNENFRDLLLNALPGSGSAAGGGTTAAGNAAPSPAGGAGIVLRESPRGGISAVGLTRHHVTSARAAYRLMARGCRLRTTGSTYINEKSSRSHAIFILHVGCKLPDGSEWRAKM